jgi:hypothetical protein
MMVRNIPRDLRDMFKAACAVRGITMRTAMERFMRDFVEESNRVHMPIRRQKALKMRLR